jgi:putative transcriptional regulator
MANTTQKAPSRISQEILQMADDMHCIGVMDGNTHQQITVRHLGHELPSTTACNSAASSSAKNFQHHRIDCRNHCSREALRRSLIFSV